MEPIRFKNTVNRIEISNVFFVFSEGILLQMEQSKFRKLNLNLRPEPLTDVRPWAIAGWLFAIAFIIFTAYTFIKYKGII